MQATITARRFNLDNSLREYIEGKVAKFRRFHDGIIGLEVILGWEKASRYTKFVINVQNKQIVVKENAEELRESFDLALDRAVVQLKRYKDKAQEGRKSKDNFNAA